MRLNAEILIKIIKTKKYLIFSFNYSFSVLKIYDKHNLINIIQDFMMK